MTILNTNDDTKISSSRGVNSEMAMSTIRGEMYRSEGKANQDCVGSFSNEKMTVDILCDGLGGYADENGELAARFCSEEAEKIASTFSQKRESTEFLKELLENTVKRYEKEHLGPNAGTTLLLMITLGSKLTVYHLGDSRAMFFLPDGTFVTQTTDHKPKEFSERFRLTKYLYQTDPEQLFQERGTLELDLKDYPQGLIAVLLSDGVTDNLKTSRDEPECRTFLSDLIRRHRNAPRLCEAIITAANDRMAFYGSPEGQEFDVKPDNSACLVRWF